MLIKDLISTDFINYKYPAMYIAFPNCSFKCEVECGVQCCQNSTLAKQKNIDISIDRILELYEEALEGGSRALVCAGLEPIDSFSDLLELIKAFRLKYDHDIVIYTGYIEAEISAEVEQLKQWPNIIVKFGRYNPKHSEHFDNVLGVKLANNTQYARKIS